MRSVMKIMAAMFCISYFTHLYIITHFLLFYRGTDMVQIYDKNPRN
jgi:hypothetical protein